MTLLSTITKATFKSLSATAPATAASIAFNLFQRTRKKVRNSEESFFKTARHFQVPGNKEMIDCYELGNPNGELILLIHGWDSNAGSLSAIADKLATMNYRVVTFNFPAHGTSKLKKANLLVCSEALLNVLAYLKPKKKFSVIAHSFGSAVTAYTLSKVNLPVNKIMFLTTPNRLMSIFDEFGKLIGLGKNAYKIVLQKAEALLGEPISKVNVQEKMKLVQYEQFVIVHDLFDKVLAHKNSLEVHNSIPGSRLITTVGVGHYKMLWDEKVLNQIEEYFHNNNLNLKKAS